MKQSRRRKCRCCKELFKPDPRNLRHQQYCSKAACRKSSKAASQQRWLSKEENQNYFKGPTQVQRVREWRQQHPGYWRRPRAQSGTALQDHSLAQVIEKQSKTATLSRQPLQEDLFTQPAVFIGLIAHLTGFALQDDIVAISHQLLRLGSQILTQQPQGATDDYQTSHRPTSDPTPA